MTFHVGQKVTPIRGARQHAEAYGHPVPQYGTIYTISRIGLSLRGIEIIDLVELPYPAVEGWARGYRASCFRPIVDTKSEISFTTGADPDSEQFDNRRKVVEPLGAAHE